jgi:hypothetical protein
MRWIDKIKIFFKAQGMPKYQNMYLSKNLGVGSAMRIEGSGDIVTVKNCYYDPDLASYVYWVHVNGVMIPVAEKNLQTIESEDLL